MGPADQEEVEVARVHAHRHAERHLLAQDRQPAHRAQLAAHLYRGPAASHLVGIAREVEEERVAAELEQPAAVGDRQVEQRDEAVADGGRQLLRTHLAVLGEAFRQLGETGDVDEHDGARFHPVALRLPVGDPLDAEPGQVGHQGVGRVRVRVGRAHPARLRHVRRSDPFGVHAHTVSHLSDRPVRRPVDTGCAAGRRQSGPGNVECPHVRHRGGRSRRFGDRDEGRRRSHRTRRHCPAGRSTS